MLLGALPWVVVALLWLLRREYLAEFVADPLGRNIAFSGFLLWAAGTLWIKRIVRVDL